MRVVAVNRVRPLPELVSVVVPVFNERECLGELVSRVRAVLAPLVARFEIILVDDCSTDGSFALIEQMAKEDSAVRGVRLARNMGAQVAVVCGLDHAAGDVVITMDADLQHPPELIPDMLTAWAAGGDVVLMHRRTAVPEHAVRRLLTAWFYWMFNWSAEHALPSNSTDFRLLDRRCVDALRALDDRHPFLRSMVSQIGFAQTRLEFDSPARHAGVPKYTLRKLFGAAVDAFYLHSRGHLILPMLLGGFAFIAALAAILVAIHPPSVSPDAAAWTDRAVLLFACASLQIGIGLIAFYLHRLSTASRPAYFVDRRTAAVQADAPDADVRQLHA